MKNNVIKNIILTMSGLGLLCGVSFFIFYIIHIPASLDKVISYDLNDKYEEAETFYYRDNKNSAIIEKDYSCDELGYLTISIYAYKGLDVITYDNKLYDYTTDYVEKINVDGETAYIQYLESDDMPDMVIRAFIQHKNYIFEIRLTNMDEQVTDIQKQEFKKLIKSINFKGE